MYSELHVSTDIYYKPYPNFGRPNGPRIIGFFSLDSERQYHAHAKNLKFAKNFKNDKASFDLNLLMDQANRKPQSLDVKISALLHFLLENEKRLNFSSRNSLHSAKFFCNRGILTLIACTPYENQEPWRIVATLYRGNIYLCSRETEEKTHRNRNMTEREKQMTSWGYKFEQFILSDDPDSKPKPDIPVDEFEEFNLVFTTNLNQHTIVYRAEMDGVRCDKENVTMPPSEELGQDATINYLSNLEFIELKTSRLMEFPKQHASFRRFKTKRWWCHCYFAGVDEVLCGLRNDEGIVKELKIDTLKDLDMISQRFWRPNVCLNFLDTFFTYVKRCFEKKIKVKHRDDALDHLEKLPIIPLHFEWSPREPVRVTENYSYESDPILPQWFVDSYGKVAAEDS